MDFITFKEKFSNLMFKIIQIFELIVAIFITTVIIFMLYNLVSQIINNDIFQMSSSDFSTFLASALSLVVGLEFVKLLCQHTPENLIEVLMLAISRQMVVEHLDTFQMLLGVVSIVALLTAKKYLTNITNNKIINNKIIKEKKAETE